MAIALRRANGDTEEASRRLERLEMKRIRTAERQRAARVAISITAGIVRFRAERFASAPRAAQVLDLLALAVSNRPGRSLVA